MTKPQAQIGKGFTSQGDLFFLTDRSPKASSRPVVIVLHGALRHAENLLGWLPVLADRFDVLLVDLPGHGRSPSNGTPTLVAFTARLREFIARHFSTRDVAIVGESVGGLIALALANGQTPQVKGVLVADPPMTTSKLWPVYHNFRNPVHRGADTDFLKAFFADAFGFTANGIIGDRIYYPLLQVVKVPAQVLTGDLPLFPVRQVLPRIPCLIDEADKAIIRWIRNPHVSLTVVPDSGHLCLDSARPDVREIVTGFCATHLMTQGTAAKLRVARCGSLALEEGASVQISKR
jgi:pimeloyl-ACP methyl ester carboxylesterase